MFSEMLNDALMHRVGLNGQESKTIITAFFICVINRLHCGYRE